MKLILALMLIAVLVVSGCCCCCPSEREGEGWYFINSTQGDECVSDLSCNGDERCHNGYCV